MKKTAADQIAEMMMDAGIQRVYGVVGDSINPIVDAIRRTDGKLRWVHCRNEEVGAFAAGADALLTGQIAACAGSCGPGNLHLINGLYDCQRSRVPVLAIAAQKGDVEAEGDDGRSGAGQQPPARRLTARHGITHASISFAERRRRWRAD